MSQQSYRNQQLTQQDADVLSSRAINPDVARARGTRSITAREAPAYGFRGQHALDGLLIPSHNTQGEVDRCQLRPHKPPLDAKDKPRKYLWPSGVRLSVDVPPASQHVVRSVAVPIIFTESALKADALQSAIEPGSFCVMATPGVYGWRSEGMPLSDFQDIPWRTKDHDRITFRRPVCIAFDSDTATNPIVARARWEFAEFLRRKGARVRLIDVPLAADGGKQGVDDALAGGLTFADLFNGAYPAPDIMPANFGPIALEDERVPEVDRLRAENVQLQHANAMLVHLIKNPNVQAKTKAVIVSIYTETASKQSRRQVEHDGRVRLEARHVANDHRPIPEPGQQRAEFNPIDGSRPIVARSNVVSIAEKAAELGFVNLETVKERKQHKSGSWYWDTELLVTPPASFAEFLQPMATYEPVDVTPRKPYTHQEPCPSCGEIHSRTRQTICNGCGSITKLETFPVPLGQNPDATEADRVAMTKNLMAKPPPVSSPDPPSRTSVSTKNVMAIPVESDGTAPTKNVEPDPPGIYSQVPSDDGAPNALNLCVDCRAETLNTYRCGPCIEEATRRDSARWGVAS